MKQKIRILFEARSIYPNKSGGIENYLYMLVNAWNKVFPDDFVYIHIPPGTRNLYRNKVGKNIILLTDPVYSFVSKHILSNILFRYILLLSVKAFPKLERCFFGLRKKWIKFLDERVDIIIYPFQRERFVHEPNKTIFVMHDFREWDMKEGDKRIKKEQFKAINSTAKIVVSWPYPYKRLLSLFPHVKDKSYKIPFLYDQFEIENVSMGKKDYLFYPSANAKHKNHENLIRGLFVYNNNNSSKLKLICTGPINIERKKILDNLISEYQMSDYIEFKGFVSREEVEKLFKNSFGVITSTKYEAFSGAILEAFRFKKPVIASAIPPITEFLKEYKLNLTLFNPDSPESISFAIADLVKNYSKNVKLSVDGHNSLKKITPAYTVTRFRNIALQVIEENEL